MTSIAILGATGQLGTDLVALLGSRAVPFSHGDLDITDPAAVDHIIGTGSFDAVINCAAFVRVDDCEREMARARLVNKTGARHVAQACAGIEALCVQISTDYVFDGRKGAPYLEPDIPHPLNAYGRTKYAGEIAVQQHARRSLIVRVASLFGKTGARGKGGNFVETILAKARAGEPLRVIDDIRMSPTYAADAARLIVELIDAGASGVVHGANAGACSWYEFAVEILRQAGLAETASVTPVPASTFPTAAIRPPNSSLASVRLAGLGIATPRPWLEALTAYLNE